jgi:hypothetical protein
MTKGMIIRKDKKSLSKIYTGNSVNDNKKNMYAGRSKKTIT